MADLVVKWACRVAVKHQGVDSREHNLVAQGVAYEACALGGGMHVLQDQALQRAGGTIRGFTTKTNKIEKCTHLLLRRESQRARRLPSPRGWWDRSSATLCGSLRSRAASVLCSVLCVAPMRGFCVFYAS